MGLIDAIHLSKRFGTLQAVDDLSLQVSEGEIYGLVGADGAGKTTLLRLLCGALRPISGEIRIAGIDMLRQTEAARAGLGYIPQRFSMYEDLTVLENIRFFAEVRGLSSLEWMPRCMEILRFVGLDQFRNRLAGQLSGGMKQKLGLAVALVHRPKVLLLDEPTSGVDPVTRQDFWQLILHSVSHAGVGVLISTPYMDEAARCSRVGFLQRGKLLIEGSPQALIEPLSGQILELQGHPLSTLRHISLKTPNVINIQLFGDRLHLRVQANKVDQVIAYLSREISSLGSTDWRIRQVPPHLEDVFISLMEQG